MAALNLGAAEDKPPSYDEIVSPSGPTRGREGEDKTPRHLKKSLRSKSLERDHPAYRYEDDEKYQPLTADIPRSSGSSFASASRSSWPEQQQQVGEKKRTKSEAFSSFATKAAIVYLEHKDDRRRNCWGGWRRESLKTKLVRSYVERKQRDEQGASMGY
ncbi:hypothetical protein MMC25_002935 [Agyrium rufum]|nr:hypothetical protein [Agyrium rufum]